MVYDVFAISHLLRHTPVSISAFVFMKYVSDLLLFNYISVFCLQSPQMIIKHRTSHLS